MSFDIFMQGFRSGDGADGDGDAVLGVLAPLFTGRAGDRARVSTPDGGADVFGIAEPATGLMFNHASDCRSSVESGFTYDDGRDHRATGAGTTGAAARRARGRAPRRTPDPVRWELVQRMHPDDDEVAMADAIRRLIAANAAPTNA